MQYAKLNTQSHVKISVTKVKLDQFYLLETNTIHYFLYNDMYNSFLITIFFVLNCYKIITKK